MDRRNFIKNTIITVAGATVIVAGAEFTRGKN